MNEAATATATSSNEEAELLARLQNQFGDMDVTSFLEGNNTDSGCVEDDESSESSLEEPTPEELRAWQEAQFAKGRMKLEAKKIIEGSAGSRNVHKSALQRRRQNKTAQERTLMREYENEENDEWEHVDSMPDLGGVSSIFFPTVVDDDAGTLELAGGVNPLLQAVAKGDPDVLGTKWSRLYSSSDGDGLSFRNLCDKLIGYDGPTVLLLGGSPSASKCLEQKHGYNNNRVSLGFFTTETWKYSEEYFGSDDDCFLFSLDHNTNNVKLIRPRSRSQTTSSNSSGSKALYCHPSSLVTSNRRRKNTNPNQTNGSVHGIGIGGTPSQPRVHITETLEECRALAHDMVFEDGDLLAGKCSQSLYYFDVDCIEVWGVGGEEWISDALNKQAQEKEMHAASLEKARKVDKRQFLDDFENGLTAGARTPGLFAHRNLVEERCDL